MFRTVTLSIIRSFSPYTHKWHTGLLTACERDTSLLTSTDCSQVVSKPVWHIPLLCVQWKSPDDGQRNIPKHVEFHSKNKFEKLVHLVGFIFKICKGADKSLARPGRKEANFSVRMAWISFGALPCRKKKLDDSSRLDVVEIARVTDTVPSLFPSWSG